MTDLLIFILLIFMWCWDYPADHPAKRFCRLFSLPFIYFGLWHGWSMFAPEPIHVNRRLRAVLTFHDGLIEEWRPLGPEESSRVMKTLFARSFKFEHSVLGIRVNHLYAPLCEFLVRQCLADCPDRRLSGIELFRDSRIVNPCESERVYSEMKSVSFYRYDAIKRSGRVTPAATKPGTNPPAAENV